MSRAVTVLTNALPRNHSYTQVQVDCQQDGVEPSISSENDLAATIDPGTPRQSPFPRSMQRLLARTASTDSLADVPKIVQQTMLSTVSYVAKQGVLLARLSLTLYFYLGFGIQWFFRFIRLCIFATFLLPGFMQMIVFYFFSPRITRSVVYGPRPRNTLDLYLPRHHLRDLQDPVPVVIYLTGGAWIIGYKAWGSLLARRLSRYGVIVCCLDYRNFPQGNLEDMLEDCNTGIAWVMRHIASRGGDPNRLYIVGQSAGGQLGALTLIAQAEARLTSNGRVLGSTPEWDPTAVKAFIGVSGAYDVFALADHLDRRGLYKSIFGRIMAVNGKPAFKALSPFYAFQNGHAALWKLLPRMLLLHGTADNSVPCENAVAFSTLLKAGGVDSEVKLYVGKTHTQPLIEDPMSGGRDVLTDEILSVVRISQVTGKEQNNTQFAMCPAILIRLASAVCPF